MRSIEIEARTVDEAVSLACKELGVSIADVNFEVLQEPTRGLLGFMGGKSAKVRVTVKETKSAGDQAKKAVEFLQGLLDRMHIPSQIEVEETDTAIILSIRSSYTGGLLIGYRGRTLNAIQYLLNQVLAKEKLTAKNIEIDFQDYRKRRQQLLTRLTKEAVKKAKEKRVPIHMEAMGAVDRKYVHLLLRNEQEVTAVSVGEGPDRHIVITPAKYKNNHR
ncbi:MAG: Jag N-terminal domain-containing protein [bacterium]|nr:Jag N-terminal domain-containing protein [bacterium]